MRLWKHDDDQRHGGQALVENRSETCAEHSGSRILRGRHESGRGPSRRGLGKTKHTELKYFWLQVATTSGNCPGGEEELLEGTEKTRIRNLHESGQVGCAICREGDMHDDGEPDTETGKG